jgi:bifunctional UDP-N-acetylglucosamine pyrophosphorylase/glucosamine-1-phosphate N-acetyltransferase
MQAAKLLEAKGGNVLVLYGDTPMIQGETLKRLVDHHNQSGTVITMLTGVVENPRGYGRIVRRADGTVAAIVEERMASETEKAIK